MKSGEHEDHYVQAEESPGELSLIYKPFLFVLPVPIPFPAIKKLPVPVIILTIPRWVLLNFISAAVIALNGLMDHHIVCSLLLLHFFKAQFIQFLNSDTDLDFVSYLITLASTPSFQVVLHVL